MSQSKVIKVVLLGSSGVGKSSLLHRYVTNEWEENGQTTLGAAFMDKTIVYEGFSFRFQIWDTAGQEKYAPLAQMYYKDANVAILVFDITNRESLNGLKEWQRELADKGPKEISLAIVANKCDLETYNQVVTYEGEQYAEECKAIYAKTSAKENIGVQELFNSICAVLAKKINVKSQETQNNTTKLATADKKAGGGCC